MLCGKSSRALQPSLPPPLSFTSCAHTHTIIVSDRVHDEIESRIVQRGKKIDYAKNVAVVETTTMKKKKCVHFENEYREKKRKPFTCSVPFGFFRSFNFLFYFFFFWFSSDKFAKKLCEVCLHDEDTYIFVIAIAYCYGKIVNKIVKLEWISLRKVHERAFR